MKMLFVSLFSVILFGCSDSHVDQSRIIVSLDKNKVENYVVVWAPEPIPGTDLAMVSVCRKEALADARKGELSVLRSAMVPLSEEIMMDESLEVTVFYFRRVTDAIGQAPMGFGKRLGPKPKREKTDLHQGGFP